MFEYFFIIGTMFMILSGSMDEFRLHKLISIGVLTAVFLLSMVSDTGIKYTVYFSWAGVFVFLLAVLMFLIMPHEHLSTLLYAATLGLLVWAVITLAPNFNIWYFKAIVFSIVAAMLSATYFQGTVISVFSCLLCDVFTMMISMDLELMSLLFFTGDSKTTVIVAFILPIIIMAVASRKQKEIKLESINGAS